ncbi:hypothetical protein [Nonlabens antarcticus]|uniref:hypothetical protein n=1 Tax=Nonlabens antarcticus TaxID=392714 RepID=UPI0018918B0A|nr:hypothetical protein [Nonlabens antarcticus]
MKTHNDIHDYFVKIESQYPVDSWSINGVDIWPYLRIKLYYHLINFIERESPNKVVSSSTTTRRTFKQVIDLAKDYLYYRKKISEKKRINTIFLSIKMHRVNYQGRSFNRFFDSMIKAHNLQDQTATIEMQGIIKNSFNSENLIDGARLLNGYKAYKKILRYFGVQTINSDCFYLNNYEEFLNQLRCQSWFSPNLNFHVNHMIEWSNKIISYSELYSKLLKRRSIKRIIAVSYYGYDDMAAAILASNNLNVETIDFQHGPQTNVHMAYSSWNRLPDKGFNTMPKVYWNWDQLSSDNIQKWWGRSGGTLVTGQPWLAFFKQNMININKCDILYTLQIVNKGNMIQFFSKEILNFMRIEPFIWTLRIHPRNLSQLGAIEDFLKLKLIPKSIYKIELPQNFSLVGSLQNCRIHITNYSGSVIEACLLNRRTVIIDKTGSLFFENYIDGELVHYVDKHNIEFRKDILKILDLNDTNFFNEGLNIFNPIIKTSKK